MYTTQCTIRKSASFELESLGNGAAYTLRDTVQRRSVFFQGDDADILRGEIDLIEAINPTEETENVLGILWDEYEGAAQGD